ncbi:protein rotatin homolog isoform X1 [Lutzomyia longipalpis]|uniref:protein rotatin homolog isoform X1 n=1 Tax=Lutzomyia longipalpis TaxID=7200 RepID=UPI002483374D|nr:protein rotatin homolog isoform X1 [Lutzomyia longipalpis]
MEISISPLMVEKLSHPIQEIRIRALRNLEGKLSKALISGYEISLGGVEVIRALLRWFSQEPLCEEALALNVIFLVLNSKYGPEIIKYLTRGFLMGELSSIRRILKDDEHRDILQDIVCVIEQSQEEGIVPVVIDLTEDLPDLMENLHVEEVQLTPREYVKCWSCPKAPHLQSLELMRESLLSENEQASKHAVECLSNSLKDYPAEWILQPPYLITTLQELLTARRDIGEIVRKFNEQLIKRISLRECTALYMPSEEMSTEVSTQISVSKYCRETFEIVSTMLKGIEDQATINWCFDIFSQLVHLLTIDAQRLQTVVEFCLRELGILCKIFRKCLGYSKRDFAARKLYIKVLQLILRLRDVPGSSGEEEIVLEELNIARLDFVLKTCYPDIYSAIEKACPGGENTEILLKCEELLRPAVDLLSPTEKLPDDEILLLGVEALKSSSIHRSTQLAETLLNAIVSCIDLFPVNCQLRTAGEWITLKLLANPCLEIQRCAYTGSAEKMKHFVSSLMRGEQLLGGRDTQSTFRNFGIPLTREILTEIVAFGCIHADPAIHSSAETMLLFILRSRVSLKEQWRLLKEIVFPILPLLQCWMSKVTPLGEAIRSTLLSDNDIITPLDGIQRAVRLLFCPDPFVRDTAISWLLEILSCLPNSPEMLPNDITLIDYQIDMGARFKTTSGHHDVSVDNLIAILESDGVEAAVRKTTVMQLNLLALNPNVNEQLSEGQGWVKVLEVLDKCFKLDQTRDYVDICIPAIGVFSKILLHSQKLRQDLADEINIYFNLLRGLLMFHHDANLKADAATALFLLAFADYSIGAYSVSLPHLMKELKVPFAHQIHWSESPHGFLSELNEIFEEAPSRPPSARIEADPEASWQFIRISFANLWFGGLENVLTNARNSMKMTESSERINYAHIVHGKDMKVINFLHFNDKLKITKRDLFCIYSSLPMDSFRYFIHKIEKATTHQEVAMAIAHIQCNLSLHPGRKFPMESLVDIVKKFFLTPPTSAEDSQLYLEAVKLMRTVLEHDEDGKAFAWLFQQINQRNSSFVSILKASGTALVLLEEITALLKKVVEQFYASDAKEDSENFLGGIFSALSKALKGCFVQGESRDMNRGRILMDFMAFLADIVSLQEDKANNIVSRLLQYTASVRSLCQSESKFLESCLVAIRGFMVYTDENQLKPEHVRHMSELCSHTDMCVRQNAWMILCGMAERFQGAALLVDELKFLPGGFHACCIGTALDGRESGIIRESAACCFANLTSHCLPFGGIASQVSPRCSESLFMEDSFAEDAIGLIVRKHNLAGTITKHLEHAYIWDVVPTSEDPAEGKLITSPNVINGFSLLLKSIIDIDESYVDVLLEENCLETFINVLAMVPTNPTEHTFKMATGICSLLIECLEKNEEILEAIAQIHAAIASLLFLQDAQMYSEIDPSQNMFRIFIKTLAIIGTSSFGFNVVTTLAQQRNHQQVFSLLILGLDTKVTSDLQLAALEFLEVYLQMGLKENNENFMQLIEPEEHPENPPIAMQLFQRVDKLYRMVCARDKPEKATFLTCNVKKQAAKVLGLLLQCSASARIMAQNTKLFSFLIKRLEAVATFVGASCARYVRRSGEVKKKFIVEELRMITQILSQWFKKDRLEKETDEVVICKVLQRLWTWNGSHKSLQNNFLVLLLNLSECSKFFCRCAATHSSANAETILELMMKNAVKETKKAKQEDVDVINLHIIMRFLINCCSCIEGRMAMTSQGLLEHISQFHPHITRLQRSHTAVIEEWLTFYEILTRYPEGRAAKYLTVLTALIQQSSVGIRRKAVKILQNFAMDSANTAALFSSEDFMRTVNIILDGIDREDQLNVSVAICSMIANRLHQLLGK